MSLIPAAAYAALIAERAASPICTLNAWLARLQQHGVQDLPLNGLIGRAASQEERHDAMKANSYITSTQGKSDSQDVEALFIHD